MKITTKSRVITLLAIGFASSVSQAATLVSNTTAPTDVLVGQSNNSSWTASFSDGTSGENFSTTRGQTFLMGDTGDANTQFAVTSITVQKNGTFTYDANSALTLWVFEWSSNDGNNDAGWNNGTSEDGIADGDPFDGTTISNILVNGEVSSIANQTLSNNDYLHFSFGTPLLLDENKTYAYLIGFNGLDTSGTSSNNRFQFKQGPNPSSGNVYADGAIVQSSTTSNSIDLSREMTFWVSGTVIPEPSAALLGALGTLLLLRRRR